MKRFIDHDLQKWATKRDRKPLIVRGPRHVGKTYSIRKMARQFFDEIVEVNFELMPQIAHIFEKDLDARRIMGELSLALNKTIVFGKTLIFFDEIQVVPDALTSSERESPRVYSWDERELGKNCLKFLLQ